MSFRVDRRDRSRFTPQSGHQQWVPRSAAAATVNAESNSNSEISPNRNANFNINVKAGRRGYFNAGSSSDNSAGGNGSSSISVSSRGNGNLNANRDAEGYRSSNLSNNAGRNGNPNANISAERDCIRNSNTNPDAGRHGSTNPSNNAGRNGNLIAEICAGRDHGRNVNTNSDGGRCGSSNPSNNAGRNGNRNANINAGRDRIRNANTNSDAGRYGSFNSSNNAGRNDNPNANINAGRGRNRNANTDSSTGRYSSSNPGDNAGRNGNLHANIRAGRVHTRNADTGAGNVFNQNANTNVASDFNQNGNISAGRSGSQNIVVNAVCNSSDINGSSVLTSSQRGGTAPSRSHRGQPPNYRRDRNEGGGRIDRSKSSNDGKGIKAADSHSPQLVQEIQEKLIKGAVECMICYEMVRRSAPVWSCSSCYSIFHLSCIKKWARAPTSIDLMAEKSQGFNWRCPGCQGVQLTESKDIRYVCFCGKRQDPPSDLYLTPHSCGEPCGKPLEKEVPGAGFSREDFCPHTCVLQCHPGPCMPCKALAPQRPCPCGKKVITTRCADRRSVLTCGQPCDKLLACERHRCERNCHVGPCDPCKVLINASCFCKKMSEVVQCGDITVRGHVKVEDGLFPCDLTCGKTLNCGNHICAEICHPGPCGECDLLPSRVMACCCGKTLLQNQRKSCLDPVATCPQICEKLLQCGLHHCKEVCHAGDCPPCMELVTQKCRCRSTSRTVECYKTTQADERFVCEKPCGQKKNCGRHRCSERCCPRSSSRDTYRGDWDPHFCSMPCDKKLRCGQHSCESLCHSGHCPPCLETIFADLTCACGRTSIPPPQPCGTPPPSCQHPCSVPQPCGHQSSHSCHFGDCPPCSIPVAKECVGGHVILRNIPCGSKDIRCNQRCGKTRQCGLHACARTCHPPPCDPSRGHSCPGLRASCGQTCGAPRRDCRHTCTAPCHPSAPCPDLRCEVSVTIACSCGRMTATVPCDAGGSSHVFNTDNVFEASIIQKLPAPLQPAEGPEKKTPLGQRKLVCDDECAKLERKRLLADAFDIAPPNLDAFHFGENPAVSELLADLCRRDQKWVLMVEERCKYLVLGKNKGSSHSIKVHVFCTMSKEKRDAVRVIAERWKLSISAVGWEPKRFIVVHVTQKSKAPSRILGAKGLTPLNALHPLPFDPFVDMDPRLVVALLDLPGDADISALVLRFGGECELVWLNDKNALAVFSDPARAATAMRRLDHGTVYQGASLVQQSSGTTAATAAASGTSAWGGSGPTGLKGNPWKKAVVKQSQWIDDSWGDEECSNGTAGMQVPSWKALGSPIAAAVNRWSVLDADSSLKPSSSSTKQEDSVKLLGMDLVSAKSTQGSKTGSPSAGPVGICCPGELGEKSAEEVVDDWEQACG